MGSCDRDRAILRTCEIHGLVFCEYIGNSPEQVTFPLGFSQLPPSPPLPALCLFLQMQLPGKVFSRPPLAMGTIWKNGQSQFPSSTKALSFSTLDTSPCLRMLFYFLVFTPLHGIGQKRQYRISHFRDQWITINRLKMYRAEYSLMVECLSNNQKAMGSISSMGVGI